MKKFLIVFLHVLSISTFAQTQRVGIDVANPLQKLDVNGAIKIGNTTTNEAGSIRFDGTNFQGYDGSIWKNLDDTGNSGTVTSVGLSLPSIFSVTGSPVTTSGTLTAALASQTANLVFAAPDGSNGTPVFRLLSTTDIPNLDAGKITSGTLSVSRGGTGAGTLTGVLVGNGAGAFTGVAGTANQLLRRNAANTAYEFFTPTYLTANQSITLSGDVSGSGTTTISATLANSGVTAGTYRSVTVDAKGRVIAGTNPTTLAGYGITDAAPISGSANYIQNGTALQTADFRISGEGRVGGDFRVDGYTRLEGGVKYGFVSTGTSLNMDNTNYFVLITGTATYRMPLLSNTINGTVIIIRNTTSSNITINQNASEPSNAMRDLGIATATNSIVIAPNHALRLVKANTAWFAW